jgi:hypothetical protein
LIHINILGVRATYFVSTIFKSSLAPDRHICVWSILAMCLGIAAPAAAYDLPSLNLGSTSFLDGAIPPTGPGLYGAQYLVFYDADKFADANGHKLALPKQNVQLAATVTQGIFAAQSKVFAIAHPGATVLLSVLAGADVNDGLNGAALRSTTGFGDTVFGGFLSFDPVMGREGPLFAQSLELDVIVPTGRYDRNIAINPGSNFFSLDPFYAATLWLTRDWSFSGRFHYLWNATNDAPNASLGPAARSSQAGQAFHMNMATQYQLDENWGIGPNGYYLQQVTDTRVNGQAVPGRRERVFAIGPGVTFNMSMDYSIFLNTYEEFGAENRTEGTRIVLRFNAHL